MSRDEIVTRRRGVRDRCRENLGEPGTNQQVFERLAAAGWIPGPMRDTCRRMVSFRNIVVHQYLQVDVRIVEPIIARDLDDLLAFVRTIRDRLGKA